VIREQAHGIEIIAKNLSGAEVPANVQAKLYKLTTPNNFLLKRLWPKPDTVLMTKDYFAKNFPHLAFRNKDIKTIGKKHWLLLWRLMFMGKHQLLSKR